MSDTTETKPATDKPKLLQSRTANRVMDVLLILALACVGLWIDGQQSIGQPTLFWSFMFASSAGILGGWETATRLDRNKVRKLAALVVCVVVFRITWFPLMVFAGFIAALGEVITFGVAERSIIFPTFLVALFGMEYVVSWVAASVVTVHEIDDEPGVGGFLTAIPRKLLIAVGLPSLAIAFMVSFMSADDYVLFPDEPWSEPRPVPPIVPPDGNPYLDKLESGDNGAFETVYLVNAGMTFDLVPEGPWGGAVKGTLAYLFSRQLDAPASERIADHYLGYLAAHRTIHEGKVWDTE